MKLTIKIILIVISLSYSNFINAQNDTIPNYGLEILAKSNGDNIELRWAPTAKETWVMGNVDGYILQRKKLDGKGWIDLATIKPYSLEEWKSKTDTTDVNNAIAAQVLLSKRTADISNGGPFSQYLLAAQEGDNRFAYGLLAAEYSKEAATGLGLYYKDEDVKKGDVVEYRVFVKHRDEPYSGDTAKIRVYSNLVYQQKTVKNITAESKDGEIILYWSRPFNSQHFSGYYIEKSIDNGKTFKRLSERPYIKSKEENDPNNNYSYRDTNVVNYKPYQYRLVGITPFAEEGLPSEPIKAEGIDLTGPIPPTMVYANEIDEPGIFEITWDATTNAPDHAGFYVGRSSSAIGPFEKLNNKPLSLKTRKFKDPKPSEYSSTYYVVFSVDDKGNENMSVVAVGIKSDSIPPTQPVGLIGSVDSVGTVMLSWEMNTEEDLQGYRVYRGNKENHEFIQLTAAPVPGNFFFDTISLRTLTKEIFYQVVAVDHHYNPSPYSESIRIRKPDYLPPMSPTITNYKMNSNAVDLTWKVSPSDDATYQVVYRKKEGEDWTIIQEINNNRDTTFTDENVEANNFYIYTIVAVDDAGLYSKMAHPAKIKVADNGVRAGVTGVNGSFDKKCKCFVVEWDFASDSKHHFVIYRNENNNGLEAITTIPSGTLAYKDSNIFAYENGYEYKIKVVYADGGESALSPAISFKSK